MEFSLFLISFIAVGYVCLLPFVFFRKDGTFNLMWMITAAPYVALEVIFLMALTGQASQLEFASPLAAQILTGLSVALNVAGIALISMTIGSHRVPLALWHQKNDAPVNIVKHGPYSKVRHPFYTSFILIMTASFLAFPHWSTLAIAIYGFTILTLTAKKEEKKLSSSEFGSEYVEYMSSTGRFFPKL